MIDPWEVLQMNIRFYEGIMGEAEEALAQLNLDVKSFFLLASVEECKYPAELAQRCLLPKPTVTFLVKKLEKNCYVERKSVKGDLRKFELLLTQQGVEVLDKGRAIVTESFEGYLKKLTPEEYDTYVCIIKKMQT
jgi:DNA-binding MarR family transcriptional regulator